jgi:acetyl esterase/lipase
MINRRGGSRWGAIAVTAVAVVAVAGCQAPVNRPPTSGAGRYRTQQFSSIQTTSNITYATIGGNRLLMDMFRPAGDRVTKRPVLVWAHGGAFVAGDKAGDPATNLAKDFAKLGYVTVSINYTLLKGTVCTGLAVTPQCTKAVEDTGHEAQAAIRYLRAHAAEYGIDTERFGVSGDSAGAVLATVVGLAGDQPGAGGNDQESSAVQAWVAISGGIPPQSAQELASPDDAPGLLFTGSTDVIVPTAWSDATANALKANGVPAQVVRYQGAGHVPLGQINDIWPKTVDWFYQYLDVANAEK